MRPHLFTDRQVISRLKGATRSAAGPAEGIPTPVQVDAPWGRLPATNQVVERCLGERACLGESSKVLAARGDGAAALATCHAAWPEGSAARHECAFRAAEAISAAHGAEQAAAAMALCGESGPFSPNCTQHVLAEIVPEPSPSDAVDAASVAKLAEAVERVGALVGRTHRADYADMMYAVWTRESFAAAQAVTGDLFDALPPAAHFHVRMAAAYALALEGLPDSLDAAVGVLDGRLQQRGQAARSEARSRQPRRVWGQQPPSFWVRDTAEAEREIPAVFCMGAGRRTVGGTEAEDLAIALLEAGARTSPAPAPAFFAAAASSGASLAVRWTAARLMGTLYPPEATALAAQLSEAPVADAIRHAVAANGASR